MDRSIDTPGSLLLEDDNVYLNLNQASVQDVTARLFQVCQCMNTGC